MRLRITEILNLRKEIDFAIKSELDSSISLDMLGCNLKYYKRYLSQFFTDSMTS
jgi:hypothetical protein